MFAKHQQSNMNRLTPLLAFSLLLSLVMFSACKKMKPAKVEPAKETEVEKPVVVVPPVKKNLLPIKFVSANLTLEITYLEGTAAISNLKFSNGNTYLLSYTDNILKKLQKQKSDLIIQSVDYLVSNGNITRVQRFDVNGQRSTPTEKYYFEYNTALQISNVKFYGVSGSLLSDQNLTYTNLGNLGSSTLKTGTVLSSSDYTYDSKNAIFKNVLFCQVLKYEINEPFLNQGVNNMIKLGNPLLATDDLSYQYIYRTDDYPTEVKITKNGITDTYVVSYIEMK